MTSIFSVSRRSAAAVGAAVLLVGCMADGVADQSPTTRPTETITSVPSPTPDPCSAETVPLQPLITMSPDVAIDCFGSRSVTFMGYASPMRGVGSCPIQVNPGEGWLTPCGGDARVMVVNPGDGEGLAVQIPPGITDEDVPINAWVVVTGHFDDPAAKACTGGGGTADADVIMLCRGLFVLEQAVPVD